MSEPRTVTGAFMSPTRKPNMWLLCGWRCKYTIIFLYWQNLFFSLYVRTEDVCCRENADEAAPISPERPRLVVF